MGCTTDIKQLIKDKELISRKILYSFFKKCLFCMGYNDNHDRLKKIVYAEESYNSKMENNIKNYYDALIYLVNNKATIFCSDFLKRFFYIFLGNEIDELVLVKLQSKYFHLKNLAPIEKTVEFHLYAFNELSFLADGERFLISLYFLNYTLVANDIPIIHFTKSDIRFYTNIRDKGDKLDMYLFLLDTIKKQRFQEKSYYENLTYLDTKMIFETIKSFEEEIKAIFQVEALLLHGSFAKGDSHIDSDIDFIVSFKKYLLCEEKIKLLRELKKYLFVKFNRETDIKEIDDYLTDDFLKSTVEIKKIF